jgi:hypothetical protein
VDNNDFWGGFDRASSEVVLVVPPKVIWVPDGAEQNRPGLHTM